MNMLANFEKEVMLVKLKKENRKLRATIKKLREALAVWGDKL